jgi:hypothetical protein
MSKKMTILALCMVVVFLFGGTAFATNVILDTGPVPSLYSLVGIINDGNTGQDFHAVQFSTNTGDIITDIQVYMYYEPVLSSTNLVHAIIYTNLDNYGAFVPGTQVDGFNATFQVGSSANWYGLSGVSWNLGEGTFWLVLMPEETFSGTLYMGFPDYAPLQASYGYNEPGNFHFWSSYETSSFTGLGIRIYDNSCPPVPLPSAVWLLGSGLLGLGGWRRFRKS